MPLQLTLETEDLEIEDYLFNYPHAQQILMGVCACVMQSNWSNFLEFSPWEAVYY